VPDKKTGCCYFILVFNCLIISVLSFIDGDFFNKKNNGNFFVIKRAKKGEKK
jgi:hypothetical protein